MKPRDQLPRKAWHHPHAKLLGEGQHAACWWESLEDGILQVWNNHSENSDQEPEYQGRTVHYKGKGDMKVL